MNGVAVRRGNSKVDNGIEAGEGCAGAARHAPEGVCRCRHDGDGRRIGGDRLHGVDGQALGVLLEWQLSGVAISRLEVLEIWRVLFRRPGGA